MRTVPRHRFGVAHASKPRRRDEPAFQRAAGFSTPRCPGSGFAPPLAAPNAQAVPAHHTEPFTCRFFSHDPSASAHTLPHRPRSNSRRVCSRQRRCAMDERVDELRVSAHPQHWGESAVFLQDTGDLPEGERRQRRNRGRFRLQHQDSGGGCHIKQGDLLL